MSYDPNIQARARFLRRTGFSVNEIALKIGISKSTASLWTSREQITPLGKKRILKRQISARERAFETIRKKREIVKSTIHEKAKSTLASIHLSKNLNKLLCSIFIWTEGGKTSSGRVSFINSDPRMVATFIALLRSSFSLDESKFRALVHIHEYHNEQEILHFWSKVTKIPRKQFTKSYLKPHTKKRKRENYKGSILLRYYDYKVALELSSIYNMLAQSLGV